MIYVPPKILGYGLVLLAAVIVAGTLYGCGRKAQADKTSLKVARQTIKLERQELKITNKIDMRVNAEGIQTATKAQEADRVIQSIRDSSAAVAPQQAHDVAKSTRDGDSFDSCHAASDCARVLQLAREARAAAIESSAKLQPAGTGAR